MPESCNTCGLRAAPAASMTSRRALTVYIWDALLALRDTNWEVSQRQLSNLELTMNMLTLTDVALLFPSKLIFVTSCLVSRWQLSLVWAIGR
jgi:hypothetical protein